MTETVFVRRFGSFENKRAVPPVLNEETCDSCYTTHENPNAVGQAALMLYSSHPKRLQDSYVGVRSIGSANKKTIIEVTTNCILFIQRWRRIITSYDKNEDKVTKGRGNVWTHSCFKQAMPNNKLDY